MLYLISSGKFLMIYWIAFPIQKYQESHRSSHNMLEIFLISYILKVEYQSFNVLGSISILIVFSLLLSSMYGVI